ncbi:NUDIX domain-containing protein [Roseimicrobium sp. ORNL1]|uniref:NUDIX domain-containing protein n=1 Tax=Roseimicrobium sp. ORNL1 TaxID=2711231 RepID=UPI0013E1CD85|nr:NUDIX domain-containing protein [Roseimicrobium sp. ORNL1]QIF03725.1 NUDIX domain-containing protein [Roseimicrobium sp. ORNL1]
MIRNLIFDWSGTLADDLAGVLHATNGVLVHHGREALSREEFRATFRLPYTEFYKEMLPDAELEVVKELYMAHFPADPAVVPLLPHAREFLQYAAATGRRIVLLSSAPEEHFEAQARANGVRDFFEDAFCGVVDKREGIRLLLEKHGMAAEESAFIGDMRHDIESAHSAGVLSIATCTGYESATVLMQAHPDVLVPDLSRLPRLLGGWHVQLANHGSHFPVATVGALITNHRGEVLLMRTHKWSHRWGIPGGKIKRGESCEEALRREVKEETDLDLGEVTFVMVQDCVEPPEFMRSAHFLLLNYTAQCSASEPEVVLNDEAEAFQWLPWADALRMELNIPTRVLMEEMERRGLNPAQMVHIPSL